jgi:hypothetical protein
MGEKKTKAINPSLKALEALTGSWEMALRWSPKTHALVGGPASARGEARFEWIEDGHFLVQRQAGDGGPEARWLIGRDETSAEYTVLYSDSRGTSRVYQMTFADGVWRIWGKASAFHQRFEGRLGAGGRSIEGWWEKSADGRSWERDFDLSYLKVD